MFLLGIIWCAVMCFMLGMVGGYQLCLMMIRRERERPKTETEKLIERMEGILRDGVGEEAGNQAVEDFRRRAEHFKVRDLSRKDDK